MLTMTTDTNDEAFLVGMEETGVPVACSWPRRRVVDREALPWLVVCPQPQTELKAYRWLAYSGFAPYVPIERKSVPQNFNRRRMVSKPIFPGYVFVRLHPDRNLWDQVERAPITMHLWKLEGRPIILNEGHIQALRQVEHRLNNPPPPPPPPEVHPGDTVEIIVDDVWAKHLARVDFVDTPKRIGLLLNLFGRLTRIEVSANQVRLV